MKVLANGNVTMTFDEYDLYADSAKNCVYPLSDWYPNMKSAQKLIDEFSDNVIFIIWILESNEELTLDSEKAQVRTFLLGETNKRLTLI